MSTDALPRGSLASWGLMALPALLLAVVALPYTYDVTLSEPDLARMAAGMVYGAATGLHEAAGMHYGLAFSFAYYKFFYAIAPDTWLRDPDLVALLINRVGIVSGLLCALAGTAYLAKLFGRLAGVAASILFFLSPMMLPVALSGHPLIPAAACLFLAGSLLAQAETSPAGAVRGACAAAATGLLVLGLSVRAEIVLAFPFLWLAISVEKPLGMALWRTLAWKGALLLAAFGSFLALQHACYTETAQRTEASETPLATFVDMYVSVSHLPRGLFVLALGAGMATLLAGVLAAWRLRGERRFYLILALAAPALVFWLPNPQPARHLFFPVLACAILTVLWLCHVSRTAVWALAASLLFVAANQAVAELLYTPVVSNYPWSYPVAGRRPSQQVPLGAFPLAQRANQRFAAAEREEAVRLAAQAPRRLLFISADSPLYLVARLIAADPALTWRDEESHGILFTHLESPVHSLVLVRKWGAWPRDVTAEVLRDEKWRDWPVYVQPFTVSRYDLTEVPAARRFTLR